MIWQCVSLYTLTLIPLTSHSHAALYSLYIIIVRHATLVQPCSSNSLYKVSLTSLAFHPCLYGKRSGNVNFCQSEEYIVLSQKCVYRGMHKGFSIIAFLWWCKYLKIPSYCLKMYCIVLPPHSRVFIDSFYGYIHFYLSSCFISQVISKPNKIGLFSVAAYSIHFICWLCNLFSPCLLLGTPLTSLPVRKVIWLRSHDHMPSPSRCVLLADMLVDHV